MNIKIRTIDSELNGGLRRCLEKYKKIDSPAVSLFPTDNIYERPPYFAFRFNNGVLEDYIKLDNIIKNYVGKLKWTMSTKEGRRNWLIEPEVFKNYRAKYKTYNNDSIVKVMGEKYFEYCDMAVNDIEPLCCLIEKKFLP
jgi:hypothetical protein